MGLCAVLSQLDTNNCEIPIEYAFHTLNAHEHNYGSYEGEMLSVIWVFFKFRHFLVGQPFTHITDNKALFWILENKNPSAKIAKWLLTIHDYDFKVLHKPGKSNTNADSLSRLAP